MVLKDKSSLINTLLSEYVSLFHTHWHTLKRHTDMIMRKYSHIYTFQAPSEENFNAVFS